MHSVSDATCPTRFVARSYATNSLDILTNGTTGFINPHTYSSTLATLSSLDSVHYAYFTMLSSLQLRTLGSTDPIDPSTYCIGDTNFSYFRNHQQLRKQRFLLSLHTLYLAGYYYNNNTSILLLYTISLLYMYTILLLYRVVCLIAEYLQFIY